MKSMDELYESCRMSLLISRVREAEADFEEAEQMEEVDTACRNLAEAESDLEDYFDECDDPEQEMFFYSLAKTILDRPHQ